MNARFRLEIMDDNKQGRESKERVKHQTGLGEIGEHAMINLASTLSLCAQNT
jgi:hypothetical protein